MGWHNVQTRMVEIVVMMMETIVAEAIIVPVIIIVVVPTVAVFLVETVMVEIVTIIIIMITTVIVITITQIINERQIYFTIKRENRHSKDIHLTLVGEIFLNHSS